MSVIERTVNWPTFSLLMLSYVLVFSVVMLSVSLTFSVMR